MRFEEEFGGAARGARLVEEEFRRKLFAEELWVLPGLASAALRDCLNTQLAARGFRGGIHFVRLRGIKLFVEVLGGAAGPGIRRCCETARRRGCWREDLRGGVHFARLRGLKLFVEELWVPPGLASAGAAGVLCCAACGARLIEEVSSSRGFAVSCFVDELWGATGFSIAGAAGLV